MSKGLLGSIVVILVNACIVFADPPAQQNISTDGAMAPVTGTIMPVQGTYGGPSLDSYQSDQGNNYFGVWMRAEYLLWWTKGGPNPTPMATSIVPGTPTGGSPPPGAIGGAGTSLLLGGTDIGLGVRQGGKFTLGTWLDHDQINGFEGQYFFLSTASETQSATSLGGLAAPTLAIPFFDVTGASTGGTPGPSSVLPALGAIFGVPGGLTGPFVTHDTLTLSSRLQGASGYGVFNIAKGGRGRIDALAGFQFLQLIEQLDFTSDNQTPPGTPAASTVTFNTTDSFRTSNNFYGGLIGLRFETMPGNGSCGWRDGFFYRADFKLGLGGTVERINMNGSTQTNLANPVLASNVTYPGGVFTQTSNLGGHDENHFAAIPQLALSVGYAVSANARLLLGYDFLYISDVARPGDQVDPGVNLFRSALVQRANPPIAAPAIDPSRPAFSASQSSFWAQGLTLGLECRF